MFYHFDIIAATKLQNLYKAFLSFLNYSDSFKNFTADLKKKIKSIFNIFFQMTATKWTDSNTQLKFGVFLSMI